MAGENAAHRGVEESLRGIVLRQDSGGAALNQMRRCLEGKAERGEVEKLDELVQSAATEVAVATVSAELDRVCDQLSEMVKSADLGQTLRSARLESKLEFAEVPASDIIVFLPVKPNVRRILYFCRFWRFWSTKRPLSSWNTPWKANLIALTQKRFCRKCHISQLGHAPVQIISTGS
jgi:hypothetical protein